MSFLRYICLSKEWFEICLLDFCNDQVGSIHTDDAIFLMLVKQILHE